MTKWLIKHKNVLTVTTATAIVTGVWAVFTYIYPATSASGIPAAHIETTGNCSPASVGSNGTIIIDCSSSERNSEESNKQYGPD